MIIAAALASSPIKPRELSVKGLKAVRHKDRPPNWPPTPNQLFIPYKEETGDWTPRGNRMRKIIYEGTLSGADSQHNALTLEVDLENTEEAAASAEELDNIAPTLDEVRGGVLVPVRVTVEILAERAGHRGDPVEVCVPKVYVRDNHVCVDD